MRRRVRSYRVNNRLHQHSARHRVLVTALVEQAEQLLLVQLARGRFAGFWLLPSATVEDSSIEQTLCHMLPERTGYAAESGTALPARETRTKYELLTVLEEPHVNSFALRFVFSARVSEAGGSPTDGDIAAARWFSRAAVAAVLEERDVVPTLGVMLLLRGWADGNTPAPLQSLHDDITCPCGSGFSYAGCCGWDAR